MKRNVLSVRNIVKDFQGIMLKDFWRVRVSLIGDAVCQFISFSLQFPGHFFTSNMMECIDYCVTAQCVQEFKHAHECMYDLFFLQIPTATINT